MEKTLSIEIKTRSKDAGNDGARQGYQFSNQVPKNLKQASVFKKDEKTGQIVLQKSKDMRNGQARWQRNYNA